MKNLIIGLDCGASHTKIKVWEDENVLYFKDDLPGLNIDFQNGEVLIDTLLSLPIVIGEASQKNWVVGIAGVDNEKERLQAEKRFCDSLDSKGIQHNSLKVFSDIELVLWSGSKEGTGVALISGTGSNCLASDGQNNLYKTGGMSNFLSDEGSGYALGLQALHLVTKMNDGRIYMSDLYGEVLKVYSVNNLFELKEYLSISKNPKAEVAKACIPLLVDAEKGVIDSHLSVMSEVNELVKMLSVVIRKSNQPSGAKIFISGSVFDNQYFLNTIKNSLKTAGIFVVLEKVDALVGALNYFKSLTTH